MKKIFKTIEKKIITFFYKNEWPSWVLKEKIYLRSGKSFSSGKCTETPISIGVDILTGDNVFQLNNGSIVECYKTDVIDSIPDGVPRINFGGL